MSSSVRKHIRNLPYNQPVRLSLLDLVVILLTATTGLIHFWYGIDEESLVLFLAFLGYAGWLLLFLLGVYRRLLYLLGVPYNASQIVFWMLMGTPDLETVVIADKTIQIVLVALLAYLFGVCRVRSADRRAPRP